MTAPRRGAAAIFGAKIYFLGASMVLGLGLIRLLPAAEYGQYFVVNDVVSLIGAVLVAGVIQSMSRQVSQHPDRQADVRRAGMRTLGIVGGCVAIGLAALSWPLAESVFDDVELAPLLLVTAPIPVAYSLYAVHVGVFNGRRQFGLQAGFDVGFATLKAGLMLGAAAAGLGAFGALGGFAAASVVVLIVATPLSRGGELGEPFSGSRILSFSLLTFAYVFLINLVLRLDPWLVKAALPREWVGVYGVSLQVARIPYQLSVALALVIFPFLASLREAQMAETGGAYVERALRYGFVLAGTVAALLVGNGPELLGILKRPEAAPLLVLVGPAMFAYTLTYLCATVLVSIGRPGTAVALAAATVGAAGVLVATWLHDPWIAVMPTGAEDLPAGLVGAAQGVLVANGLGAALGLVLVMRVTKMPVSLRFPGAFLIATALAFAGTYWTAPGLVVVVEVAALGLLGAVLFVVTGVTPLAELRGLVSSRRRA